MPPPFLRSLHQFLPVLAGLIFALATTTFTNAAPLKVAGMFSDHMILQRETSVPVWGWGTPGENLTVQFAGQTQTARITADGCWTVWLEPMSASADGDTLSVTSSGDPKAIQFSDVVVGEVWFLSGQSNANMHLYKTYHAATDVALADAPGLRWYIVRNDPTREGPDADAQGEWVRTTPETAWEYSAYGYHFAQTLFQRLGIPVGVVQGAYGGTPCEAWISQEALQTSKEGRFLTDYWKEREHFFDEDAKLSTFEGLAKLGYPAYYYNARVAPAMPFAIRGAVWYQGESNRFRAKQYLHLFPLMVADWRQQWNRGDFPFYFVQLANIGKEDNRKSEWPMLQYVQTRSLKIIPNSGMAVVNDSTDSTLHPRDKRQVGQRLALMALAKTYHLDLPAGGPLYDRMQVEAGRIRLHFSQVEKGLTIRGNPRNYSTSLNPKKIFALKGFEIRNRSGEFVDAEAVIDGNTVVVSSPDCPDPVAARYAWTTNAQGANLSNSSGLPASLFRTDEDYPTIYFNQDPLARK